MPPSGSAPFKLFVSILKSLTNNIPWKPLPGSAPSKWFMWIANCVSALSDRVPPSGSAPLKPFVKIKKLLTARIPWRPVLGSAPSKLFAWI
eukprot:2982156-Amphidinium_carterae.1